MLPDWLKIGDAQLILALVIAGLLVVALLSIKLVRKAGKFIILTGLIIVVAAVLASQWVNLRDCYETCDCAVFGLEFEIPENVLCNE